MADEIDRLERERADADRRYNDALTAFDRALVRAPELPTVPRLDDRAGELAQPDGHVPALAQPAPVSRWRGGKVFAQIWAYLAPVFERQQAINERQQQFNAALAASVARELAAIRDRDRPALEAIGELTARLRSHFEAVERLQSALIVYLQQITGFVESKDRVLEEVDKRHAGFLEQHQRALDALREAVAPVPEVQQAIVVLQRTAQMLKREIEKAPAAAAVGGAAPRPAAASSPPATSALDDFTYVAFEDLFRGSVEDTREKLKAYVPIFRGASDVVDLGCGRGEFLALLTAEGIPARGVDTNYEMVELVRQRGLEATQSDGLSYLESAPDRSLGGLIAAQVVEHLQPAYLVKLLRTTYDKLRPGSPIVIETINPACWFAFFSSYIRDLTHVRPVHPETLQYLLQASGFAKVEIRYSAPVPDKMKMKRLEMPKNLPIGEVTARALYDAHVLLNENANALNDLLFTYLDYAAIGYRS